VPATSDHPSYADTAAWFNFMVKQANNQGPRYPKPKERPMTNPNNATISTVHTAGFTSGHALQIQPYAFYRTMAAFIREPLSQSWTKPQH